MTTAIDYLAPADLFPNRRYAKSFGRYRRFATAAEAISYAIEVMPEAWLNGTVLDIDGQRFEGTQIRNLFESRRMALAA